MSVIGQSGSIKVTRGAVARGRCGSRVAKPTRWLGKRGYQRCSGGRLCPSPSEGVGGAEVDTVLMQQIEGEEQPAAWA